MRYHLQKFHHGFVRLALLTGAPIIPTVVIGAEETHINLARLKLKRRGGQVIPIPLNLIPLPAKWKIRFLSPIELKGLGPSDAADEAVVDRIVKEVRAKMQREINRELAKRKWVFFAPPSPVRLPAPSKEQFERAA